MKRNNLTLKEKIIWNEAVSNCVVELLKFDGVIIEAKDRLSIAYQIKNKMSYKTKKLEK